VAATTYRRLEVGKRLQLRAVSQWVFPAQGTGTKTTWTLVLMSVPHEAESGRRSPGAAKGGGQPIVAKLRQVDVLASQGKSVAEAIRAIGVTEVTYYRWRQEYGGLRSDQVKRMKNLEAENARLRRAVSDLTLDKMILAEAARGNY
jgi:hypothetical protein